MTMKIARSAFASLSFLLACISFAVHAAPAEGSAAAPAKSPVQVCEAAVTDAIQQARGEGAKQVQFLGAKQAPGKASAAVLGEDSTIHGEGRYQGTGGAVAFAYRCTLDPQGQERPGVIFKEVGGPAPAAEKPWQADLTNLSPEACEAAVASAVTGKYSRAVNLMLSSQSRQLKPAPNKHTYMHGQGSAQKATGMRPSAFTYRCELDTASGKFIGVQVDWLD